ncbi:hypothetical protein CIK05_02045 [Bdellovibrio sp. qaytius]|nr:hypothetical protein CIK05_02045 [Bdellovibrio sp. qaytius]
MKKIILLSMLSLMVGCNYSRQTDPNSNSSESGLSEPSNPANPSNPTTPQNPAEATVRFKDVKDTVFDVSCSSCHQSRGLSLNFTTYTNVKKYLTKINSDVFSNQSMPPSGGLSTLQKQALKVWLTNGAPE